MRPEMDVRIEIGILDDHYRSLFKWLIWKDLVKWLIWKETWTLSIQNSDLYSTESWMIVTFHHRFLLIRDLFFLQVSFHHRSLFKRSDDSVIITGCDHYSMIITGLFWKDTSLLKRNLNFGKKPKLRSNDLIWKETWTLGKNVRAQRDPCV